MRNTAVVQVGRLVEIRVDVGYRSAGDIDDIFGEIARATSGGRPGQRWVIVTDWRRCPVMASDAAERACARMTHNNPFVERSAALASPYSPTAVLQFMRIVRDSNNEQRRLFDDPDALVDWVGEVLTGPELARLKVFLQSSLSLPPARSA